MFIETKLNLQKERAPSEQGMSDIQLLSHSVVEQDSKQQSFIVSGSAPALRVLMWFYWMVEYHLKPK